MDTELIYCELCQSRHTKEFGEEYHDRWLVPYPRALARAEMLMDAKPDTREFAELLSLAKAIEACEKSRES